MRTFLEEIVSKLLELDKDLSHYIFVLPSKRACFFLKKEILKQNKRTQFSPQILSVEEFIQEVADLKTANSIELLFEFYNAYLHCDAIKEKESFEGFLSWASILIDDFNEIDRNLIDQKRIFNYLKSIKELEHWYVKESKTPLIKNYIEFWNTIPLLYDNFVKDAKKRGHAHQGLVYREATKNLEHYIEAKKDFKHVFIGFNALNNAEQTLVKELLELSDSQVFWDAESYFMDKQYHDASRFLREIKSSWKYYQSNPFNFISNNYESPKNITLTGCTKNIGQTKYVTEILRDTSQEKLEKTALVLADENLLIPILNALPNNVSATNITMGLPLKLIPATGFFEIFLKFYQNKKEVYYYKNILQIINHPLGKLLLPESASKIQEIIHTQNQVQISYDLIVKTSSKEEQETIKLLFSPENKSVKRLIGNAQKLLLILKDLTNNKILLESLFKLNEVWNKLDQLNQKYQHIKNPKTLFLLFKEITATTSIDFQGEPNEGLQIMGLLETRSLDFENVILVGANEGVLPAGKTNKSFLPYDLKKEYRLPVYTEKDAVYSYHFYSLLHRAKNVNLVYNNHPYGLQAAEKSRFLLQLTYESPKNHNIQEQIFSTEINIPKKEKKQIEKTPFVIEKLKALAAYGFSPSGLTTYIRNPIDFYDRYILGIKDLEEIEETVAVNTLGTIVHDTLQQLYEPYINTVLTEDILKQIQKKADDAVAEEFSKTYKDGNIKTGKNLIIFEISKRYVQNFLKQEMKLIKEKNEISITQIENKLEAELQIPGINFPVKIRGLVDRVDQFNQATRIIDFKTGKVTQADLNLINWEDLTTDYKYSKIIQVLCYALMTQEQLNNRNVQAGILSFKNLNAGFMPFTKKEKARGAGDTSISEEVLTQFKNELNNLILEICNPNIPFTEKEIPTNDF